MKRPLVLALAAAATLFAATSANAARVDWSVGINVAPIGIVAGPAYAAPGYAPAYYPPPAYYAPAPRIWVPPLPPLPRLSWFGHGYEHGYGRGHDRDHDRGHRDDHVGWRR